jgi:uncharacterized membrane protein YbhN (UPF0104 family)/tRNA A-37 threonylcarbamoyl transferase component Bud32
LSTRVFAVPVKPQRFRRPTDAVLFGVSSVLLAVTATAAADAPGDLETAFSTWLAALPSTLDVLWNVIYDFAQLWVVALVALALLRRRWGLGRDLVVSLAVTFGGVLLIGWLVTDSAPSLADSIGPTDGTPVFPALVLALAATSVTVSSPYLVSPIRTFSRWLIGSLWLSAIVLGVAAPGEALCAIAVGWAGGALVHLAFGSPGGSPSLADLEASLRSIGVDATPTSVAVRNGVIVARAVTPDQRDLDVDVHGRDSWDSRFFVKLWRQAFYRSGGRDVLVNRQHQVEHQAYLTLFAEREGALVVPFVAATVDARGDAIFVTERVGPTLGDSRGATGSDMDDELLRSCWRSLDRLHEAGIRHGAIAPSHLQVADNEVYFGEFDRASIGRGQESRCLDQAQLLATTATIAGPDRAIAAARAALGVERLTEATTFVQPAAMLPEVRRRAGDADLDIDDLRKAAAASVGAEDQELQSIRRFSIGNVVMWILLLIVASAIVGAIQEVGVSSIVDAITAASLPILILALVVAQTPRFAGAFAVSKAAPLPVPYGRLSLLEFAITFVNLAVPSTAARVAVNIRFFQRNGLDRTTAIGVGGLDSVAGFVAQIGLIIAIVGFGLGSLNLNVSASAPDFDGTLILVLVVVLAIAVAVVAFTPKFREPILSVIEVTWTKIGPLLSSPRRVISVIAANVLVQLLFSLTSYTVLRAFGQDVGFADVILVNECVALFAGLMPVPGGVGVTEAALTAGYTAIGVDSSTAMAAALCYRLVTFYIPPCFGYFALRSLRRQHLL